MDQVQEQFSGNSEIAPGSRILISSPGAIVADN